jgi:hypothetical protein
MSDGRGDQRRIMDEAIRLAVDIGERGMSAITDFMDSAASDVDTTITLSTKGVQASSRMVSREQDASTDRDRALQDFESALVQFVRDAAPAVTLAAARIVTGDTTLHDRGWHSNTVTALREIARLSTSVVNDSVGAESGGAGSAGPREVIDVAVDEGAMSVPVAISSDDGPAPTKGDPAPVRVTLRVTPLTSAAHIVVVRSDEEVELRGSPTPGHHQLALSEPLRVGTYHGWIHAIAPAPDGHRTVVGSAELRVTVKPPDGDRPAS